MTKLNLDRPINMGFARALRRLRLVDDRYWFMKDLMRLHNG